MAQGEYDRLSKPERERMRLTAFAEALETGRSPRWAKIAYLLWENPDVPKEGYSESESEILEMLPTLNVGEWLLRRVRNSLDELGGPLVPGETPKKKGKRHGKPTGRRRVQRRKVHRKAKGVAHVGKARGRRREVQRVGHN